MPTLTTKPLQDDLPFGVRISGVTWDTLKDPKACQEIVDLFEERGIIVFEGMERTTEMQVAVSNLFGPLEDHPFKAANKLIDDTLPGVIDMESKPNGGGTIIEIEGEELAGWTPWHFDSSYTKKLCRGAVLRAINIPPEGGRTGFADGVQLYHQVSPGLRDRLEGKEIIYHPSLLLTKLRYAMPKNWRYVSLLPSSVAKIESVDDPNAMHPAIWTRRTGEKVLHLSQQNASGIVGMDQAEADALLEEALQEIQQKMTPYWHVWSPNDMVIWDNWRMLHKGGGTPAKYGRRMHRTTIGGDYGLGRFDYEPIADRAPEFAL